MWKAVAAKIALLVVAVAVTGFIHKSELERVARKRRRRRARRA